MTTRNESQQRAVPITIRCPSRAGRLAARYSHLSYRLKPRSTSRSITSALDRLVLHPRRDRSTSIMTSAQPGGSYEDRRETHGFLVTSLVPSLKATHAASSKAHARRRASAANIRWCVGRKARQRRVDVGRRASFERTRCAPPARKKKKSFHRRDARMRTNA